MENKTDKKNWKKIGKEEIPISVTEEEISTIEQTYTEVLEELGSDKS